MLGSELRAMRKEAGFRANRLATAMDITSATLSRYENGKAHIPKKVELAARYLCEPALSPKSPAERLAEAMKELMDEHSSASSINV